MDTWQIVALVVVAVVVVAAMAMLYYPPLMHRHQLAHEMAGFAGRSWGASDIVKVFWGTEIVGIEEKTSPSGIKYDFVRFKVNSPSHGMVNWGLTVFFNKKKGIYEGYCAISDDVKMQIIEKAQRMGCERSIAIADEIAATPAKE